MNHKHAMQVHRSAAQSAKPLNISPEGQAELVQMARDNAGAESAKLARHSVRLQIDREPVVLSVIHPGGTHSASESILFDIGPGGAAVLYPGFLYGGTDCGLHLATTDGKESMLGAKVAWCRCLSRGVHCVGLRWSEEVDVRRYVPSSLWSELNLGSDKASMAEVSGRLLCIGVEPLEINLIKLMFQGMPVEVEVADDAGATFDSLHAQSSDVLLINSDSAAFDSEKLIAQLRQEGFAEPVILLADKRNEFEKQSGGDFRVVSKPLDADGLLSAVRELMLAQDSTMTGTSPISSSLASKPEMVTAIEGFVEHVRALGDTLRGAISADNTDEARKSLLLIHNTASGFGFGLLGEASAEALKELDASGSAQEAAPHIRRFVRVLDRVRATELATDVA